VNTKLKSNIKQNKREIMKGGSRATGDETIGEEKLDEL
jgi:hypothetical protein